VSIPRPVIVHTGLTAARPASGAAVSDRSNLPRLPLAPRIARLEPISLFTTALPSHRDSTAQFERHCTGTRSCSHRTLTRSKSVPGVDSRYHERDRLESQLAAMNPPLKFACASCVHRAACRAVLALCPFGWRVIAQFWAAGALVVRLRICERRRRGRVRESQRVSSCISSSCVTVLLCAQRSCRVNTCLAAL